MIELIFCNAPHNIAVKARPLRALGQFLHLAGLAPRQDR
jgi:hypothetical protein